MASPLHAEEPEVFGFTRPPKAAQVPEPASPGEIHGEPQGKGESAFSYQWRYRPQTYEMHFQHPEDLSRRIYALALAAGDISPTLPREKFYKSVNGFHYSAIQIADWLNQTRTSDMALTREENEFVGELLKAGIIVIGKDGYLPGNDIKHVLGAAPGKERTFAQNLLHERLHVFWDETPSMRDEAVEAWRKQTESEKSAALQRLKNYNLKNENQLIEEWTILEDEENGFNIK